MRNLILFFILIPASVFSQHSTLGFGTIINSVEHSYNHHSSHARSDISSSEGEVYGLFIEREGPLWMSKVLTLKFEFMGLFYNNRYKVGGYALNTGYSKEGVCRSIGAGLGVHINALIPVKKNKIRIGFGREIMGSLLKLNSISRDIVVYASNTYNYSGVGSKVFKMSIGYERKLSDEKSMFIQAVWRDDFIDDDWNRHDSMYYGFEIGFRKIFGPKPPTWPIGSKSK